MDGGENQPQVSRRRPQPLEIASAISTFPQLRLAAAMGKWKSRTRIPTSPQPFHLSRSQRNERRPFPPATLFFRLILGLENAPDRSRKYSRPCRTGGWR